MGEIPEPEGAKLTPEPSSCLSLRVFYLKLSRCELNEPMLDTLTITHTPLTSDTVLGAIGDRATTDDNGNVSCPLHRDRVNTASREATFVSTETVRMAGSVRFEVRVGKHEKLLVGIMEMCDVPDGFGGVEKNGCWVMKCQVSMQRGSGFLKSAGEDAKSPMIEVYVASLFRGNPIVFTKAMKLRFRTRRRQVKAPFMEPIPECGEHAEDAKETPPADQKHDPQGLSEYRCYKPEPGIDDVDLDSLYARTAGLEGEDSELSWFTAGVRIGVGISLGIILGVGVSAGLLARSYRSTSRSLRRRLIGMYKKATLENAKKFQHFVPNQFSKYLKENKIKFEDLVQSNIAKLGFTGPFKKLDDIQKLQVYENIIAEAGQGKPVVTYSFEALGKVGVALLVFTAAAMVWDIYTAEDKLQAAVRDSVNALTAVVALEVGGVVNAAVEAGFVALDIEIASAVVTVIGAVAGFGVGVLIGIATSALLDTIFSSGTSKVKVTDGLTVCRVAPMPDGLQLARLVKHNYPDL